MQWKNYENRPTSDEVIVKIKRCAFFWDTVYIMYKWQYFISLALNRNFKHVSQSEFMQSNITQLRALEHLSAKGPSRSCLTCDNFRKILSVNKSEWDDKNFHDESSVMRSKCDPDATLINLMHMHQIIHNKPVTLIELYTGPGNKL